MKNVLVTGANGFIGKNLCSHLRAQEEVLLEVFTREEDYDKLEDILSRVDVIYHLAGVNRPESSTEFEKINIGLTERIIQILEVSERKPTIIFTSSAQVSLDNPYGQSKLNAEKVLSEYAKRTSCSIYVYRLTNVFGKWCKPNYNSVVATFCYNVARNLGIQINNPDFDLNLVYIDDVIESFLQHLDEMEDVGIQFANVTNIYTIKLQKLADLIISFKEMRNTLILPNYADILTKYMYSTYLAYLPEEDFSYKPLTRSDKRGNLVELLKSDSFGQIFVSSTLPGITRGNHYHHTKVEKFCVVSGEGIIRFRHIENSTVLTYFVSSKEIEIVDIPPGYTHSIENTGSIQMVVLFWANEIFNPDFPDTYYVEV